MAVRTRRKRRSALGGECSERLGQGLGIVVERGFEAGDDVRHLAVPEESDGHVLPLGVRCVEDGVVPEEALVLTAIRLRLPWLGLRDATQFLGHKMIGVPELTCSWVRNPSQRAAARRAPVGGKDGLPNHQHAQLLAGMMIEKLLDCGGPPQTDGSCRRKE